MSVRERLSAWLRDARNGDGGWGYYRGKSSRLEPTSWAMLALAAAADDGRRHQLLLEYGKLLDGWEGADGLFADSGGLPNLAFNGLAAVTLRAFAGVAGDASGRVPRLHRSLVRVYGTRHPPSPHQRQDNGLRGWPWTEGTSSWVEPTAWCLLALKRLAPPPMDRATAARTGEAEALLLDRACTGGGWNYGNSNMMGQQLRPYVPTTATVLLALQDRKQLPAVGEGLMFIQRGWKTEPSGPALSLTMLCLSVYGVPCPDVAATLEVTYRETDFLGNVCTAAMAACALLFASGSPSAFKI